MSIKLMTLVWQIDFPTPSQKLAALKIADFANDEGANVWPSKDRLAREIGCSKSTAIRIVNAFLECGILHCTHKGGNGVKDPSRYIMNVGLLTELSLGSFKVQKGETALDLVVVDEKGVTVTRFEKGVSVDDTLKCVTERRSVSVGDTQTTNRTINKPSTRGRAREPGDGSRLPAQGAGADAPAVASFDLSPHSHPSQWAAWMDHLRKQNQGALADRAEDAEAMTVFQSRWPSDGAPLPKVSKPENYTSRMIGEAAE